MKYISIPLVDYIDIDDEQCDVHIHTKDKRILVFKDVRSNADITEEGLYLVYLWFGQNMNVFISRDDFSHIEYRYSPRHKITKKDFDDLYSYLDEDVDYEYPAEALTEPSEHLFDDLI